MSSRSVRARAVYSYRTLNDSSTATDWEVLEASKKRHRGKDVYLAEAIWAEKKVNYQICLT